MRMRKAHRGGMGASQPSTASLLWNLRDAHQDAYGGEGMTGDNAIAKVIKHPIMEGVQENVGRATPAFYYDRMLRRF